MERPNVGAKAGAPHLELVSPLRPIFGKRQDLDARFGDHDRVLELGGETSVLRADRPAVALGKKRLLAAGVDHRLDRKADAGLELVTASFRGGVMRDGRRLMVLSAHPV